MDINYTPERAALAVDNIPAEQPSSVPVSPARGGGVFAFACAAVLLAVVAAVFYPCLASGYINWDDLAIVRDNPQLKNVSLLGLDNIFSSYNVGHYHPLTTLSFMVERIIFGTSSRASHAINMVFHALNATLAYFFALCFLKDRRKAFFAALLFTVHPMHVESVAWVSERKDMLYSVFYLSSLICYERKSPSGPHENYLPLLGLFMLALISKSMAVTLPAALLLLDWLGEGKITKDRLLEKLPFFALAMVFARLAVVSQGKVGFLETYSLTKIFSGLCIASGNLLFYLWRFVLPVGLSPFYPYPDRGLFCVPALYCFAPALLAPLAWLAWKITESNRKYAAGLLFFLITISPGLQFIPSGRGLAGDHFTYLPYLGLIFIAADLCFNFYDRASSRAGKIILVCLAGWILALGAAAHSYCYVWKDSITVWNHVLAKYPLTPLAYNNRGVAAYHLGGGAQAVEDLRLAVIADPLSSRFLSNYATMLVTQHQMPLAMRYYKMALEIAPDNIEYLNNLGSCYFLQGDLSSAFKQFNLAVVSSPDDDTSLKHLAYVRKKLAEQKKRVG